MTRLRTALLAALLWCGVVAVVATLVWVVISRAGQGVVPVTQPQADLTGSLPVPGDEDRPVLRTSPGVDPRRRVRRGPRPLLPARTTTPADPAAEQPADDAAVRPHPPHP